MNCLCEAIGMALPGNGTIPAVSARRVQLAKYAGMRVMQLLEQDLKPRDILTRQAFEKGLAVDMAWMLHKQRAAFAGDCAEAVLTST